MPTTLPTTLPIAARARARPGGARLGPLAAACMGIAAAAAALALFVGWGCGDVPAAALIAVMAGGLIALLRRAAAPR